VAIPVESDSADSALAGADEASVTARKAPDAVPFSTTHFTSCRATIKHLGQRLQPIIQGFVLNLGSTNIPEHQHANKRAGTNLRLTRYKVKGDERNASVRFLFPLGLAWLPSGEL
jgi:hypothetical protein